jgi:hypothetical protein
MNISFGITNNLTARQRRETGLISVGARFRNRLWGRNNLPFSGYIEELSSKLKQLDGEDDLLFPSSARDQNEWTFCYTPFFMMGTEKNVSFYL